MTMSVTSGGGISADDVLVLIYGSAYSGASTAAGSGVRYSHSQTSTETT